MHQNSPMPSKEAQARIKINKLLETAGWRFFDSALGKANIALEPNVKLTQQQVDALGNDFETSSSGFIDFLLLDEQGFPLVVLEAKAESKNPLNGKEQARKYAKSQKCRFVILSNGNLHYLWDLQHGNPQIITRFPAPDDIKGYARFQPDAARLVVEPVPLDYIARTQMPGYDSEVGWQNEVERSEFIRKNRLRFMRAYQQRAVQTIQQAVKAGSTRFLFEMATGTGRPPPAAAVIKLFLRTGNARRVLFLVDRLELEDQANKAFVALLRNDFTSVIYKEKRDDWRKAEIVVTTVQSLLFNSKYKTLFSPTDFDLVISDEAHRSIGGNARAVFEYFVGYKLGLTATPKDYLKKFDAAKSGTRDPREQERRLLLDTYRTFGCESGEPTCRYSLLDGVRDGFLINPLVVDARTEVTTQLLSDLGYAAVAVADSAEGEAAQQQTPEQRYKQRDFEKKFFSEPTNRLFCETLLQHGLRDPVSGEFGKSIVFGVSQNHAAKLVQLLNELADQMFPGLYQSDFAVQVTSLIPDAQQFTINFTNNNLMGSAHVLAGYKTSKARVCVTVGMMTTGYDCPDLLNLALMRPVFSPSDFVQIKGRGTRKHSFLDQLQDESLKPQVTAPDKTRYKLFDFFANCEYFEEKFNYDEVLKLPRPSSQGGGEAGGTGGGGTTGGDPEGFFHTAPDRIKSQVEQQVGFQGMKVDRMFFEKFEDKVMADTVIAEQVQNALWDQALERTAQELFDKPDEYFNLDKLRRAAGVDRRLGLREILEKIFGLIPGFKNKDELLEEEFDKFLLDQQAQTGFSADSAASAVVAMKYYFKAYATDHRLRDIIETKRLTDLNVYPAFGMNDFKAVPPAWRTRIPEYVKDYVPLNQFM